MCSLKILYTLSADLGPARKIFRDENSIDGWQAKINTTTIDTHMRLNGIPKSKADITYKVVKTILIFWNEKHGRPFSQHALRAGR